MRYRSLIKYIRNNDLTAMKRVIRNMPDLGVPLHKHPLFGASDIMWLAIMHGSTDLVKLILEEGYPLNPEEAISPLEYACLGNRWEMVGFLLLQGSLLEDRRTLSYLAARGKTEFIKNIVSLGIDINTHDDGGGNMLHWAVQEDQEETVEYLIEAGCDINTIDDNGQTPLYVAAGENGFSRAKRLLDCGAKVDLSGTCSPFQIACSWNHYEMCDLLLSYGADINYQDTEGRTALFYKKVRQDQEGIQYLIARGADDTTVDYEGISIRDLDNETIREELYKGLYE